MVNLEEKIGLPARLMDTGKLSFSPDVDVEKISERKFSDLKPVLQNQNTELSDDSAYTMYRNVKLESDRESIENSGLRFDLTVIPAAKIGNEYIKTSGHYHPNKPGTAISYPELYFVAHGTATYLLQKGEAGTIADVIVANIAAGEAIIIPPGYGHVTINEEDDTLVMANWISDDFQSIYSDFEKYSGGAYYIVDKFGSPGMVSNDNYGSVPAARGLKPNQEILGTNRMQPIYSFSKNLSVLDFLINPENHQSGLEVDRLFTK